MRSAPVCGIVLSSLLMARAWAAGTEAEPGPAAGTNGVTAAAVTNLIRQLGDSQFAVREVATKKLAAFGETVHPALRRALKDKELDPEAAERIRGILRAADLAKNGELVVNDADSGTVLQLSGDGNTVSATKNGRMLWQALVFTPGNGLAVENGVLVIKPTQQKLDIATGTLLSR
jgi:hypothetical protein